MSELPYNKYDADEDYILENIDEDPARLCLDSSFDLSEVFKPIDIYIYDPYIGDEAGFKLYIDGEDFEANNCYLQWDNGSYMYMEDVTEDILREEGYENSVIHNLYKTLYEVQKYLNEFQNAIDGIWHSLHSLDQNNPSWCTYLNDLGITFEGRGEEIQVFENGRPWNSYVSR